MKTTIIVMLIAIAFQFSNAQCVKTYDNESLFGRMYNEYVFVPIREAVPLADEITKPVKVSSDMSFNFMKSGSAKYLLLNLKLNKELMLADKKLSLTDAITLSFEDGSSFEFKPNISVGYFGIDDFSRTAIGAVKITTELKTQLQKSPINKITVGDQTFEIKKSKGKKFIKSCCYLG